MIPMTEFGTPFKVAIPSRKHWLLTWPMTLQSKGLLWSRMAGGYGTGVCGMISGMKLSFGLGVHVTVFQQIFLRCQPM
jgi:hypothetical protein